MSLQTLWKASWLWEIRSPLGPDYSSEASLLCSLLACFADGILPLDMEGSDLLSDTFEVLSSREIKLLAMRSKPDKDLLMEEDDMALANVVMQEAQKKLISQVQKRNFIENIIPIIITLKTVLEKNKIPALRELMNYLREVMQDYRDEIKDFFGVDKQLASELEYDMKKYNEQLTQEQELAKQDVADGTAGAPTVQVAPRLEIMAAPESTTVLSAASLSSAPRAHAGQVPPLFLPPETGPVKRLMPRARYGACRSGSWGCSLLPDSQSWLHCSPPGVCSTCYHGLPALLHCRPLPSRLK